MIEGREPKGNNGEDRAALNEAREQARRRLLSGEVPQLEVPIVDMGKKADVSIDRYIKEVTAKEAIRQQGLENRARMHESIADFTVRFEPFFQELTERAVATLGPQRKGIVNPHFEVTSKIDTTQIGPEAKYPFTLTYEARPSGKEDINFVPLRYVQTLSDGRIPTEEKEFWGSKKDFFERIDKFGPRLLVDFDNGDISALTFLYRNISNREIDRLSGLSMPQSLQCLLLSWTPNISFSRAVGVSFVVNGENPQIAFLEGKNKTVSQLAVYSDSTPAYLSTPFSAKDMRIYSSYTFVPEEDRFIIDQPKKAYPALEEKTIARLPQTYGNMVTEAAQLILTTPQTA